MIKTKTVALQLAQGRLERLKIKTGWTAFPSTFLCRNIQEFVASRNSVPMGSTVMLPRLYYFQQGEEQGIKGVPILLKDESGYQAFYAQFLYWKRLAFRYR
jgi:hypothetical protein